MTGPWWGSGPTKGDGGDRGDMRVNRADLGPLKELASGGYGKVHHALQYRLPGDPAAIAYKEFTTDVAGQARSAENAVSFRDLLNPADRADLDRCTVWPRAVVEERGAVTGLLMPLIPGEFFFETTDPASGDTTRKLRELQWLIATPTLLAENGVADFDDTERFTLLGQLVYEIARLHKQDWVYGDLSFKNAAFAVDPPRMILLDCDGAADTHDLRRKQAHSLGWEPPECAQVNIQDKATDVYKLGLAILRCLNPGPGAATMKDPRRLAGRLDTAGMALIERAVGQDPARRPTAKELYAYLRRVVAARVTPPEVVAARLVTPLRVRGMDARVEWEIKNVQEITIRAGANPPETVTTNGQPQVHIFRPRASGPVTIEAANRYGAVRVDLGELILYDLPVFDPGSYIGTLPRLAAPALEAFTLDALAPALATVPRVTVPEFPKLPSVPTADLSSVLKETLLPGAGVAGSLQFRAVTESLRFPDLGALAAPPAREIAEILTSQTRQLAESQRDSYLTAHADAEDED